LSLCAPLLAPLLAVAAASVNEDGTLHDANAGFLALVSEDKAALTGAHVAEFFIQPNFAALLRTSPDASGHIHCGLLTIGHYTGKTRTVRGRVWREGTQLHLLAEHEIADLERLNETVLALNRDYADAQAALARANLSLQQLNTTLEQRVAERTAALRDALRGAEAASRAKTAFLANMSHELRTPLNAILGLGQIVGSQVATPKLREHVGMITDAGRHLLDMVTQMLAMSKLQAEESDGDTADFDLSLWLAETCMPLRQRAEEKGLALNLGLDPSLPRFLRGDPTRLEQIVTNLVANAIKFSVKGSIDVSARMADADAFARPGCGDFLLQFEVVDQGIGIAVEQQASMFDMFEQADNSTTRKYGGLGLGLAICRRLAERMGGTIGVSSVPGQGSRFWFTARLKPAANVHAANALAADLQVSGADKEMTRLDAAGQSGHLSTAHAPPMPEPADMAALDGETLNLLFEQLDTLLAQDDTAALSLVETHAATLSAALGAAGEQLVREVGEFSFNQAQLTLRALRECNDRARYAAAPVAGRDQGIAQQRT
jgi:signal transduction histidine kinase